MSSPEISPVVSAEGRPQSPQPWWKYKMLWLVAGGPAAVVVASLVTAVVAIRGQDPVLAHGDASESPAAVVKGGADAMTPAVQARNHAATAKP